MQHPRDGKITTSKRRKPVRRVRIPFFNTQMGKGSVTGGSGLYMGAAALSERDYVHRAIDRADLIVAKQRVGQEFPVVWGLYRVEGRCRRCSSTANDKTRIFQQVGGAITRVPPDATRLTGKPGPAQFFGKQPHTK